MKQFHFIAFVIVNILPNQSSAQQESNRCCLSAQEIIGTWQRDDSLVGSGLNQNFQFFKNNYFVLNIGNDRDDVRNIIQLKGRYRLEKDTLFFIITSRTIVDGPIEIPDAGISSNIFSIRGKMVKEVIEHNPKEMPDPCYITLFTHTHIKINQEIYYKIK
ncbi:MAG: hypothetical protein ACHQF0_13730 [Chitinophagales bacterium]